MLLIDTVIKKCKVCLLIRKIKRRKKSVKSRRLDLMERNQKYHNGRLEIDDILEKEIRKDKKVIYNLKREIVKER